MQKVIRYKQIYDDLLKQIIDGDYAPGDRLPSEKELSASYGVSRITAKKAMELLFEKKYINRTPGRGSFVNRWEDTEPEAGLNIGANALRAGRVCIAVIFDTFGSDFGSELIRSIEQTCSLQGFDMIFKCSYGSIEKENEAIDAALKAGVRGIILMCAQDENYNSTVLRLALNGFPLVLVDRSMNGISIPCVKTDNYTATRVITRKLIEKGHERICFVTHGNTTTTTIHERYEGFADTMMEYDYASGSVGTIENYNPAPDDAGKDFREFDYGTMETMLEENKECTAFLTTEYRLAILLDRFLKSKGINKQIATFDGIEPVYENDDFIHLRQDEHEMGTRAVHVLQDLMRGKNVEYNIDIPYLIHE